MERVGIPVTRVTQGDLDSQDLPDILVKVHLGILDKADTREGPGILESPDTLGLARQVIQV